MAENVPRVDYGFDVSTFPPTRLVSCGDSIAFLVDALPPAARIGLIRGSGAPSISALRALGGTDRMVVDLGGIAPHTPYEAVMPLISRVRDERLDTILAIGGGSLIDAAKLAAIGAVVDDVLACRMEFEPPSSLTLNHVDAATAEKLPSIVAVPTTAGSGSEISAGFGMRVDGEKILFNQPAAIPRLAVYDPHLAGNAPPSVRFASWGSAVARGLEALYAVRRSWLSDAWALQGLRLLGTGLPGCLQATTLTSSQAQAHLAGSLLTAKAIGAAGGGLVHAIGHAVGGLTGLPHGLVHAALLPAVLDQVARELPDLRPQLESGLSVLLGATRGLVESLEIYGSILADNVRMDWDSLLDVRLVAERSLHEPLVMTHPTAVTEEAITRVVASL